MTQEAHYADTTPPAVVHLDGCVMKIGRVAVLPKNPLHERSHPGTGTFPVCPIDGDVALETGQQFMGNDPHLLILSYVGLIYLCCQKDRATVSLNIPCLVVIFLPKYAKCALDAMRHGA